MVRPLKHAAPWLGSTIVWVLGCGPEAQALADLEELCGVAAPVHVLPLEDHEVVGGDLSVARVEERWLYAVRSFEDPIDNLFEVSLHAEDRTNRQVAARVESVDRCGRDRSIVGEGIDIILEPLDAGEPWLGYRRDTHELYWFDPHGRFEARRLAATKVLLWAVVHGSAVFVHRAEERDVVRITLEGDGQDVQIEVLATDVERTSSMSFWGLQPTAIAALRDNGDLLALDLQSGSSDVMQTGVRVFANSDDLRWIAWAPGDPSRGDQPLPREAWLLDRETREQESIAFDGQSGIAARIYGDQFVAWRVDDDEVTATRFRSLYTGLSINLPGNWWWFGTMPDGAFGAVLPPSWTNGGVHVFAPVDGELVPIVDPIEGHMVFDDAIWSEDFSAYADLDRSESWRPFDLVKHPYPTFEPHIVERRIYSGVALDGDRWIRVVAVADPSEGLGRLEIIDGETGRTRILEEDVGLDFAWLEPHPASVLPWRTDEIVYQMRDADGSRTGLWRARFSP